MAQRLIPMMVAAALVLPASAVQAEIGDFSGQWTGVEILEGEGVSAGGLSFRLEGDEDAFTLSWVDPEGHTLRAEFGASDRPEVYAQRRDGGLLGMIFSVEEGNPLEGHDLMWVRTSENTVHIYSLAIDAAGAFILDHWSGTVDGTAMELTAWRLLPQGGVVQRFKALMERTGG